MYNNAHTENQKRDISLLTTKSDINVARNPHLYWRHMQRSKFILGGLMILAAVVYLIVSSTQASAEYFMTIEEVNEQRADIVGKSLRISGAVIGDTITYNPNGLELSFEVAHVTGDNDEIEANGGLAQVLHDATVDPLNRHLQRSRARSAPKRSSSHYDRASRKRRHLLRRRTASQMPHQIRRSCPRTSRGIIPCPSSGKSEMAVRKPLTRARRGCHFV